MGLLTEWILYVTFHFQELLYVSAHNSLNTLSRSQVLKVDIRIDWKDFILIEMPNSLIDSRGSLKQKVAGVFSNNLALQTWWLNRISRGQTFLIACSRSAGDRKSVTWYFGSYAKYNTTKNSRLDYSVLICRKNASDEGKWWHGFAGARS